MTQNVASQPTFERSPIRWYRLAEDGQTPLPLQDLGELSVYAPLQQKDRHVGDDHINGVRVSTVFLALDHQTGEGLPLLWETMIFDQDGTDVYCERYSSHEEAVKGHQHAVTMVEQGGAL